MGNKHSFFSTDDIGYVHIMYMVEKCKVKWSPQIWSVKNQKCWKVECKCLGFRGTKKLTMCTNTAQVLKNGFMFLVGIYLLFIVVGGNGGW